MDSKSKSEMKSMVTSSSLQPPTDDCHDVQSSLHDGGGHNSSPVQAAPAVCNNTSKPPCSGRLHLLASFVSLFSGILCKDFGLERKPINCKGWRETGDDVIVVEESHEDVVAATATCASGLSRRCKIIHGVVTFLLLSTLVCLIVWGIARPYEPDVIVKSLVMDDLYIDHGTDHSGVPTKMVTVNCSLNIDVNNPSSMFGIHFISGPIRLKYSDITIGVGQIQVYSQPRKSHQVVTVVIHGEEVPLYGAGGRLSLSTNNGSVPVTIEFELKSRGYIVGKLLRVTHKARVACHVIIDTRRTKPIKLSKKACTVYKS